MWRGGGSRWQRQRTSPNVRALSHNSAGRQRRRHVAWELRQACATVRRQGRAQAGASHILIAWPIGKAGSVVDFMNSDRWHACSALARPLSRRLPHPACVLGSRQRPSPPPPTPQLARARPKSRERTGRTQRYTVERVVRYNMATRRLGQRPLPNGRFSRCRCPIPCR